MTQMKGHINQASQDMGDAAKDVAYSKGMTVFARIGYAVRYCVCLDWLACHRAVF